jgi:hypothetical protein
MLKRNVGPAARLGHRRAAIIEPRPHARKEV